MMQRFFRSSLLFILLCFGLAVGATGHTSQAAEGLPLTLEMQPLKRIYSSREGIVVQFVFKAQRKTKLCLEKDILTQMQFKISRSGSGNLPLQPLVVRDNRELFREPRKVVWLEPGKSLTLRANLKRFTLGNGESWLPGEYSVSTTFSLCGQNQQVIDNPAGLETPLPARQQGWFMIMS